MTRTEIIDQAKQLVMSYGPDRVCEFGEELLRDVTTLTKEQRELVLPEAVKQAHRVYKLFGYVAT